jgi:putative PIN family toxin of toxin-antitoxin system
VRVFLDTNVLVSAFATRGLSAELLELVLLEHQLITGRTVLDESRRALRGKLKMSASRCIELAEYCAAEALRVVNDAPAARCEADPQDRKVLGEALAGEADVFVTGDGALLAIGVLGSMPILTPRQFWELLRRQ